MQGPNPTQTRRLGSLRVRAGLCPSRYLPPVCFSARHPKCDPFQWLPSSFPVTKCFPSGTRSHPIISQIIIFSPFPTTLTVATPRLPSWFPAWARPSPSLIHCPSCCSTNIPRQLPAATPCSVPSMAPSCLLWKPVPQASCFSQPSALPRLPPPHHPADRWLFCPRS